MWQPFGKVQALSVVVAAASSPPSIPIPTAIVRALAASSRIAIARSVPATRNVPSANWMSAAAVSNTCAANVLPRSMTRSAASLIAAPCAVSEREPPVPPPILIRSLSPWTMRILSNGTFSRWCSTCI